MMNEISISIKKTSTYIVFLSLTLFSLIMVGCGQEEEVTVVAPDPVIIQNGEECDLCGMYINRFPGPKGQVFERGGLPAKRFCSTRDMFAYALQPEHQHRIEHIYVHDVATAAWNEQEKAQYIDAKTAIYVSGHRLKGAMGPALASFSKQADAEQFAAEFGGELLKFSDIDIDALSQMNHQAMHH